MYISHRPENYECMWLRWLAGFTWSPRRSGCHRSVELAYNQKQTMVHIQDLRHQGWWTLWGVGLVGFWNLSIHSNHLSSGHWGRSTSRFVFSSQTSSRVWKLEGHLCLFFHADMHIPISIDFANLLLLCILWSGSATLWSPGKSSENTVSEILKICDGIKSPRVRSSLASVID